MINNKSVLCLVLARKNSKGLPGKNLKKNQWNTSCRYKR